MPRVSETSARAGRPTRWAGVPAANRVAERRGLLLDAALELLGTEGWAGTTVRGVCHAARLNPRYFYESFPDLDALVVALFDRLVHELRAEVTAAVAAAGADPRARIRATVESTVRFVDEDRRRARVLYVEALGNEALNRRRLETGSMLANEVAADVAAHNRRSPAGAQVAAVTGAFLVGGFSELLVRWIDGAVEIDREQLVEYATELFIALGRTATTLAQNRPR